MSIFNFAYAAADATATLSPLGFIKMRIGLAAGLPRLAWKSGR